MPNKLLNDFNKSKELLFAHVGFEQDGGNYPIEDGFDYYYWQVNGQVLLYAESKEELITGQYHYQTICQDSYFPQSVFRGKYLSMITVNSIDERTLTLFFLDNAKEIKK
jgi:hypothetical protein